MFRDRDNFGQGVSAYVPAMQYANALIHAAPAAFSLGIPAASDDDIVAATIDADAVAGTLEAYNYTSDARYGRNMILTISGDPGAAGGVIEVRGFDYLMQPMLERFTGVNGATAILYGKKAFYKVTQTKIITAATNAVTAKLGTGKRLGLPYKGDIQYGKEGGVHVEVAKNVTTVAVEYDAAATVAGGNKFIRAPFAGYVQTLRGIPSGGGSATNAATTVELGGTAIIGLTVTVDQDTTTVVTDVPTTTGYNANNRFDAGDLIEIVHAATTGGGAMSIELDLVPVHASRADLTDPATASTGDPRGTYHPNTTLDGIIEVIVGMVGDTDVNAAGNGGLHGIRHYYA